MNKRITFWFLALAFLMVVTPSFSQDGHYWTQQYGTRSMLLSGSVIGGVEDLGAVYYNPGRLAIISNSAFLLSASVYEYTTLEISGAFTSSKKTTKSDLKGVPTLAAGTFKVKFLPKHHFAYAILTRQSSDINIAYSGEKHEDVIAALPGEEYFGAQISLVNSSLEQWIGLTWSYPVSPKLSVGVTTNFSINNQSKGINVNLQALSQANEVAVYRFDRSYNYKQNGLLWKVGLASELGKWQLGLTATTPLVHFQGTGNYQYEEFFSSIPTILKPEVYTSSYQEGLQATYETPWSVGFGVTRKLGRNKIYASTEWFSAVPLYNMMSTSHVSQINPNDTIHFQLVDQFKSVWNAGIGMEFYLSEHVSGYASFSSDFTAVTSDITRFVEQKDKVNNSAWNADFYHFGGGVVIKLKGADITLGATHTGAKQTVARPVNFPENSTQPIFNSGQTADLTWDRWRLVFSFSLPFLKDYADKLKGGKEEKK